MEITTREFKSIGKLLDYVESVPEPPRVGTKMRQASFLSEAEYDNYAGDLTLRDCINAARFGTWKPNYADEIRDAFDELVPRLRQALGFNYERRIDRTGDQVDIDAYVQDRPETMYNWFPVETETKKHVVTVLVGVTTRGCSMCRAAGCTAAPDVTAEDIYVRGQALIGLLRSLKLLGYELEIWTEQSVLGDGIYYATTGTNTKMGTGYSILTRVQAAGEITDDSAIEFACGHPGWARRIGMRVQELEYARDPQLAEAFGFVPNRDQSDWQYGQHGWYGIVTPPLMAQAMSADLVLDWNKSWFPGRYNDGTVPSKDIILEWTLGQLVEAGVLSQDLAGNIKADTVYS